MWYGYFAGSGVSAHDPQMQLIAAFIPAFLAAGQPSDFAVFTESADADDSGREDVTIYLSPAAAAALRHLLPGCAPCERPERKRLRLAAGEPAAWSALFP